MVLVIERLGERLGERLDDMCAKTVPSGGQRLSDTILQAFHQACDQGDLEVAEQLVGILDMILTRRPCHSNGSDRRMVETAAAAHKRVWHLRHDKPRDA